jgi:hypothetical protein
MPVVPIRELGHGGVITDLPSYDLEPNQITECLNVRFKHGRLIRSFGWINLSIDPSLVPSLADSKMFYIQTLSNVDFPGLVVLLTDATTITPTQSSRVFGSEEASKAAAIYGAVKFATWQGAGLADITNTTILQEMIDDPDFYFERPQTTAIYGQALINLRTLPPIVYDPSTSQVQYLGNWGKWDVNNSEAVTPSKCTILTHFKNFFIALNMKEDIVGAGTFLEYKTKIRWSDTIDPQVSFTDDLTAPVWYENDPSSLSGFTFLPDETDSITAASPLGDRLMIYTLNSCYSMYYTGDTFVFRIQTVFKDEGALNDKCVTNFGNKQFVVGNNDVYIHDGSSKESIVENKIRNRIYGEFKNLAEVYVQRNELTHEIMIYYATNEAPHPVKAAVWNWDYNYWTFFEIPEVFDMALGFQYEVEADFEVIDEADLVNYPPENHKGEVALIKGENRYFESVGESDFQVNTLSYLPPAEQRQGLKYYVTDSQSTYESQDLAGTWTWVLIATTWVWLEVQPVSTWSTNRDTWNSSTETWDDIQGSNLKQGLYYVSWINNKIYRGDVTLKQELDTYTSYIERVGIDLDRVFENTYPVKRIKQVLPQVKGDGDIFLSLGATQGPVQAVKWNNQKLFEVQPDEWRVNTRITGRYLSYRYEMLGEGSFEVSGMDLNIEGTGNK